MPKESRRQMGDSEENWWCWGNSETSSRRQQLHHPWGWRWDGSRWCFWLSDIRAVLEGARTMVGRGAAWQEPRLVEGAGRAWEAEGGRELRLPPLPFDHAVWLCTSSSYWPSQLRSMVPSRVEEDRTLRTKQQVTSAVVSLKCWDPMFEQISIGMMVSWGRVVGEFLDKW